MSNMRTYTKQEWECMTKQFQDRFTWETGELISKFHIKVSYLIGYPKIPKRSDVVETFDDQTDKEALVFVGDI